MNRVSLPAALRRIFIATLASVVVSAAIITQAKVGDAVAPGVAEAIAEKKADVRLRKLAEEAGKISAAEIPAALTTAAGLAELRERAVFRDAVVKRWGELSPFAALDYLNQQPESRNKLELIRIVAAACAKENPPHAATAVGAMRPGRTQVEATGLVAEAWAKADMRAALAWARGLPACAARDAAWYSLRFIWVHADPAAAATDVQTLPAGDTKNALLMNIAGEWAARDPQPAIAWARSLPDPNEQQNALAIIAESWADTHPADAAEFAGQLPSGFRAAATVAVLTRWATQDPARAAAWAVQLPDESRQRGLAEVFNVWTAVDPVLAERWAEKLEPPLRDLAQQAYAEAVVDWAPESAVRMALATADPANRWLRVSNLLGRWWEQDPAAARQWLDAADFPAEAKRAWRSAHGGN